MPTFFEEYVWNSKWEFNDFLFWNLAAWLQWLFGGPFGFIKTKLPYNSLTEYIIQCLLISFCITVFYLTGIFVIFLKSIVWFS